MPPLLARIAAALERLAPPPADAALPDGDAFVWEPAQNNGEAAAWSRCPMSRMWTSRC